MRVLFSENSDPVILDSRLSLRDMRDRLKWFSESADWKIEFQASAAGNPAPYAEFLNGLRIEVVDSGSEVTLSEDRWLELRLTRADLDGLCDRLTVDADGAHNHLYTTPLSLIIEADDELFD